MAVQERIDGSPPLTPVCTAGDRVLRRSPELSIGPGGRHHTGPRLRMLRRSPVKPHAVPGTRRDAAGRALGNAPANCDHAWRLQHPAGSDSGLVVGQLGQMVCQVPVEVGYRSLEEPEVEVTVDVAVEAALHRCDHLMVLPGALCDEVEIALRCG